MASLRLQRHADAPPETVWALVEDHRHFGDWAPPIRSAELEAEGDPPPNGLGAIRVLHQLGPTIRERIVAYEPPRHLGYEMLSGAPVRDYRGDVVLEPEGAGTRIVWTASFRQRLPGVSLIVGRTLRLALDGLVAESERRALEGLGPAGARLV